MSPLLFVIVVAAISVVAGFLGALLGLGGGIIIVPTLTLLLGVDIRLAIGASIVSVIATSSGAAAAYVRDRMANIRVAMFLELGTAAGAITGAYLAGILNPRFLFILFGLILAYSAFAMLRGRKSTEQEIEVARIGLALMYFAGVISGLLGIGSGSLKVPAMDLAMELPIKVSTATSNFKIGVTAAASAGVYFSRGQIDPFIAGPVAIGVMGGAFIGSHTLGRISSRSVRFTFVVVLTIIAAQMLFKGVTA